MNWPGHERSILLENKKPTIVILGAGICGASAAHALQGENVHIIVLEASKRVGGKLHTVRVDGKPIELGATWLHCTTPSALKFKKKIETLMADQDLGSMMNLKKSLQCQCARFRAEAGDAKEGQMCAFVRGRAFGVVV